MPTSVLETEEARKSVTSTRGSCSMNTRAHYLSCLVSLRPHQYMCHSTSTVCVSTSQSFDECRVTLVFVYL